MALSWLSTPGWQRNDQEDVDVGEAGHPCGAQAPDLMHHDCRDTGVGHVQDEGVIGEVDKRSRGNGGEWVVRSSSTVDSHF